MTNPTAEVSRPVVERATKIESDERVLKAAAKLFREKGFAATTVREIAAGAAMLPGSLHYRYASKDDILIALMQNGVSKSIEATKAAIAATRDPVDRIRLGLRAHLELLLSDDDSLFVLLFDWRSLPAGAKERVEAQRQQLRSYWDGLIFEAAGTGRARMTIDLELVYHFGFGALNWVATWYDPASGRTPAQIADALWLYLAFGVLNEAERPATLHEQFAALMQPAAAVPQAKS